MNWSLVLGIVVMVVVLLMLLQGLWTARSVSKRKTQETKIVQTALERLGVVFKVTVFRVNKGTFVQTLYGVRLDTVLQVTQYVPPNFDHFTSKWFATSYGLGDSPISITEYQRRYISDDKSEYAICVTTVDGFWPIHVIQYLDSLT